MDQLRHPNTAAAFFVWLLMLIFNAMSMPSTTATLTADMEDEDIVQLPSSPHDRAPSDTVELLLSTFQNFNFCSSLNVFHDEVQYWVKPRSTTWFSRFLLQQYDNNRWISMFRMTKPAVFALSQVLRPNIERKNTTYRLAVPVLVRVACTLFKLTHGANLTVCSKMFAIGRSTVSKILREVVHAINECLRGLRST